MKLHLPKALLTAVMALFAVSQTVWGEMYNLLESDDNWAFSGRTAPSYNAENDTITASSSKWTQGLATYTLTRGAYYTDIEKFEATINVTGTTGVMSLAFTGVNETFVLGDLAYEPATLLYGTTEDTTSFAYHNGGAWDGSKQPGTISTAESLGVDYATGEYVIVGTVNNTDGNYTLDLTVNGTKVVTGHALGSSFDVTRITFAHDAAENNQPTLSTLTLTGTLYSPTTTYATILGEGSTNVSEATWTSGGSSIDYADIPATNGADSVVLDITGSSSGSTAILDTGTNVYAIDISGGNVTLQSTGSVNAKELVVKDSATATIGSDMTVGTVTAAGGLEILSDATLTVSATDLPFYTANGFEAPSTPGTNLSFLANTTGTGTILLNKGGGIAAGTVSEFKGVLEVAAGKMLQLSPGSQKDKSEVDIEGATIRLNEGSNLWIQGHGVKIGAVDVVADSSMRIFDGDEHNVATEAGVNIGSLSIAAGKTLLVQKNWEGNVLVGDLNAEGKLDMDHGGDVYFTIEAITASGNIDNAGQTTLGKAGEDSVLNIGGTIANTGTLILADAGVTLNVSDIADFQGTIIYDTDAALWDVAANAASTTGNGFSTKSGYMQVISNSNTGTLKVGDAEVADLSAIKVTYKGAEATLTENGQLHGTSTAVSGDYILGGTGEHASANLSDIVSLAATANTTLEGVTLRDGNTLTVDATPVGVTVDAGAEGTSTLDIAASQTVNSADVTLTSGSMKFTGSGTYSMQGGLKGEADSAWTGTVRLETTADNTGDGGPMHAVQNLDLTKYGNENSKIVIQGVMGSLAANMGEVKADIEIKNSTPNGSWAGLDLNEGTEANYTFSGDFSGGGNLIVRKNLATDESPTTGMGFTFKGKMSDFTGYLKNQDGYNTYTFSDKATAVSAQIQVVGGTMVLNADNAEDTTFKQIIADANANLKLENKGSGTMKVSKLNDATNSNITVTATSGNVEIVGYDRVNNQDVLGSGSNTTVASIDVAANKNVKVTGNLTVTGTLTVDSTNALTVHDGSLTLSGATVDASGFTLGTELNDPQYVFTLGTATGGISDVNGFTFTGPNVDGYKVDCLVSNANDINNVLAGLATADESSTVNDTLYLVLTKEATTTPLTEVMVTNGSWDATNKVLTLTTNKTAAELAAGFGEKLNAVIGDALWEQLTGNVGTLVDVSFTTADGNTVFDFDGLDNNGTAPIVTLNGIGAHNSQNLAGDGTIVGSYVTAYIPEPTSTTLSLLALAALAVRRRRK
ncbi:MAG: hypothetical protein IJN29_00385 [Akkermansia sp.]|nr:hypothetical protein [Akkermansia sp.]